ncbi:MAG TPA: radical SAM protein, partial [Candidatus Deferrimicrobium sp.]|nr:radical SAM protein [Candidatus Deferrimicrobium sp.]
MKVQKTSVIGQIDLGGSARQDRDYIFYDLTRSTCPECLRLLDAKIVLRNDGRVTMLKRCPDHGEFEVLVASDKDYYCNTLPYNKPGSIPCEFGTQIDKGCPNDCGLCPDHEQHTCLALLEITDSCNMNCPICYASSGQGNNISLETAKFMLEKYVAAEGRPEVLQISGGVPTLHPQLHEILHLAKESGLKAFLINTNGLRLAEDEDFVASLQEFGSELEIYLQYDGLTERSGRTLRGRDMANVRQKALDNLEKYGISANLVTTLARG